MTATPQSTYPRVTLRYCTRCDWLLRAAWLAQELLQTFNSDLGEVVLQPGDGGIFQIHVETENGHRELIWCRATEQGFPEAKTLKQRLRDQIAPGHDLGHNDR